MGIIEYISSFSLIIVTGVLCYFTYCLWIETQRMRKKSNKSKGRSKSFNEHYSQKFFRIKNKK